ncbi:MAG: hypothetical protein B6D56_03540 [Candidatus Omnitrophica bacterium 4484_70.1]|nr:MAG: hypothetical protein B6D56_03540 [Candidatus Omnitrophica bacterium 4484_70.1]
MEGTGEVRLGRRYKFVLIIVASWFFLSFLFLFYLEDPFELRIYKIKKFSSLIPPDLLIQDSWYSVYLGDSFIGYTHFLMKILEAKRGKGYLLKNESRLKIPVLGVIQPINLDVKIELGDNYSLNEADLGLKAKSYSLEGKLKKINKDEFYLMVETPAQIVKKKINVPEELITSIFAPISLNYIPPKKKISLSFFDPFLEKKIKMLLRNKGKRRIKIRDKEQEVWEIEFHLDGAKGKIFTDSQGIVVKQEFLGFKFVKEDVGSLFPRIEKFASSDLADYFSVPSSLSLSHPEKLSYLKVKLKGLPCEYNLEFFNQKVIKKDGEVILEIFKKQPRNLPLLSLDQDRFKGYLTGDNFIVKDSPKLKKIAVSVVGEEKDAFNVVKKLSGWINKNIKKIPTFSLPNTLDVLKMKQGDCGEISALLVGFLRSVGIPSWVNIGLVYQKGRFFYHAWVSCFVGEWIDTDPALNQLIADPTHIKLFKGLKNQFELFKFLGSLQIEIMEFRYD